MNLQGSRDEPPGGGDEGDPFCRLGLQALREDNPSEHSRRAVLARLGLAARAPEPGSGRETLRIILQATLLGAALGLALVLLQYLLT